MAARTTSAPPIDEYERRRRHRETVNERAVSTIIASLAATFLGLELSWTAFASGHPLAQAATLAVPVQVRIVTAVILAANLAILLVVSRRRAYFAARKYLIVAVRISLLGLLTWAQWHNPRPDYGLLVPIGGFAGAIVVSALAYSRAAVLFAGPLACLVYPTIAVSGPAWPESIKAAGAASVLFLAITAVTYRVVSSMLTMSAEAVSNERLSRFFSPEVAARIAAEPEVVVRAAACRVTVLFSDITGFTAMSGRMTPGEVVNLLNEYFPRMVEIVFRHGGTLEKFVGDALLAVWGAPVARPDDADRAVAAALEMQRAVSRFNAERQPGSRPEIAVHMGIASGPAAAGYIGTDRYVQYAVIGDTTNVAARICSAAGPGEVLVADETRLLHSGAGVRFATVAPIAAKGKDAPVTVHRVNAAPSGREAAEAGAAAPPAGA